MRALLIIDIQNDYFPGGKMELFNSEAAADKAGLLLDAFRKAERPIFHVQHIALDPETGFFLPDTPGVEINARVKPLADEAVVRKHYPSAFQKTYLLKCMDEADVTELVIAGMMTHMCVDTTVRAACGMGLTCTLAHDACATRDLSFGGRIVAAQDVQCAYLAALDGVFAQVLDTETILGQ